MARPFNKLANNVAGLFGYKLIRRGDERLLSKGVEPEFVEVYERCRAYTMTSVDRMYALYQAVRYVVEHDIDGDIVECGVWRGGSTMLVGLTLMQLGVTTRDIHLYDTFAGMAEPTDKDRMARDGSEARTHWKKNEKNGVNEWCYASLDEVRENMRGTGYPEERLHFVKGKVEETIPAHVPGAVALLRLDTDWYESTYHELVHLYPLLRRNGILLLDDYGYWAGAKEATDTYFSEQAITMFLSRIDNSGRIGVKSEA